MKRQFSNKIAKDIAEKNFGHTLDCVLGYSDSMYTLSDDSSTFEQNFEEDLEEKGIKITPYRVKICCKYYDEMVDKFKKMVRKKYYTTPKSKQKK